MSNSTFFLAVDGGGTKTTVWLADQSGEVLGKATTGPMSLAATTPQKATEHFLTAIREAIGERVVTTFEKVVVGLAGVDTPEEVADATSFFSKALREHFTVDRFEVVNDTVIALASGTQSQNAICLISGTGSNCFGKNAAGKTAKAGGMDYLLSDQGSGFDIGQQVLRAAVKSYDYRARKTLLEKLVCEHFEIESIAELKNKVYHPLLNKTQIGELGKLCFTAREHSDTTANEIIMHAVNEIIEMIVTVLMRLHLTNVPTDVVLIGGIATDPFVKTQLEVRLQANYPLITLMIPEHPPVYGALQLARK